MEYINGIMFMICVGTIAAIAFTRENIAALDWLAAWAASRAYGLKCAQAEYESRVGKVERAA